MDEVRGTGISVRRILSPDTWALRAAVLWPEKQAGPGCALEVDDTPQALHFGTFCGGELVTIGSFFPERHPSLPEAIGFRLRAMATAPGHRGKDHGRQLIQHAEDVIRQSGEGGIWADARLGALGFYARLGWDVTGPFYEVPKRGPHRLVHVTFRA